MSERKIQVKLDLENKQYLENIRQSESALDRFAKSGSKLSRLSIGFMSITAAAGGLSMGIKGMIEKSEEMARAEARLNKVLESTKMAAGLTSVEIKKMAESLQKVTTYDSSAIIEGQNLLLTFTKIGKDVFPMATEAMLDMSEMMGTDLKTSAIQLGKALNDPIQGIASLRRYGVQLSKSQEDQIKQFVAVNDVASAQKVILDELGTQMGGQARAATETLSGKFKQLQNAIGGIGENIGGNFTPVLFELTDALVDALQPTGFLTHALSLMGKILNPLVRLLTNFIRKLNLLGKKSELDKLKEKAIGYEKEIESYRAKGLEDDSILIQSTKRRLAAINQQMKLLSDDILEDQQKIHGTINKTQNAIDSLTDKQKKFVKLRDEMSYKKDKKSESMVEPVKKDKETKSMVEYYERLGQYQNAAIQKEYESFQAFQETQNYKTMSMEEQAIAEKQYQDARIVAAYEGAQIEAEMKEKVLRAKMGMESQAFKGAQMFAQAGMELMNSQNKELFRLGVAASLANVALSTSEAIMKGYAQLGAFGGSAFAALMAIVSARQVANILSQKPPESVKKKESVQAPTPTITAPAFARGVYDIKYDTPAFLHKGETVLPKAFSDSVKDGDLPIGGTTIIVQGSIIDTAGLLQIIDDYNKDIQRRTGIQMYFRNKI